MTRNDWLKGIGLVILSIAIFGIGYWAGVKISKDTTPQSVLGAKTIVQKTTEALAVPGVYWIKAGEQPVCPDTHVIKAKFDNYTGYFYAVDHKGYDKIKPVLCFASEEYATKNAGFLKKY